jgi:hypothetical protein
MTFWPQTKAGKTSYKVIQPYQNMSVQHLLRPSRIIMTNFIKIDDRKAYANFLY